MTRRPLPLAAIGAALACLTGCSCSGSDAPDASPRDVGAPADAIPDSPHVQLDAPPRPDWTPAFPARRVFHDPSVRCAPLDPYAYAPPLRSTVPGDLLWSVDPVRSPGWEGVIRPGDAARYRIWEAPFTLLKNGGLLAIAPEFAETGVAADGGPAFYFTFAISNPFLGPHMVLPDDRSVTIQLAHLWIQDPTFVHPRVETLFAREATGNAALVAPALGPRGDILWAPDDRTVTSSCVADGAPRWVVEVDPHPSYTPIVRRPDSIDLGEQWRSIYAMSDGGVVWVVGPWVYRFDIDGSPRAEARVSPDDRITDRAVYALGVDPTCGLAVHVGDRLHWYDSDTLELRHVIRYADPPGYRVRPLHDCGVLEVTGSDIVITGPDDVRRRLNLPFSAAFMNATVGIFDLPIELADGTFLFLMRGRAPVTLGVAILRRGDPSPVLERVYSATEIGERVVDEAYHLTPDGLLRIATQSTSGWRISSIDIGTGPALPLLGRGTALDPMHTNSVWASEALRADVPGP